MHLAPDWLVRTQKTPPWKKYLIIFLNKIIFSIPPVSASQAVGLKVYTITP